ncbi:hypothetical protein JTB14_015985 [Gonioctena quinquepunctata]|nr:hypothetical protein JTB14_015985 [Gonioctena quinquepunctata]
MLVTHVEDRKSVFVVNVAETKPDFTIVDVDEINSLKLIRDYTLRPLVFLAYSQGRCMAPKKNYKPEQMAAALGALERGIHVSAAAKEFNVPRVTLLYKWKGKSPRECSMGPSI